MNSPKAFIFDLNGTMINDMQYHITAWSDILNNDLNAGLSWDEVKMQMYGKNDEVLERIFGKGKFTHEKMTKLSFEKERRYQLAYLPNLKLINGLDDFLQAAENAQIPMAIGSAAIPFNINFVLDNLHLHKYFPVVVSADDVVISKPHPETYLKAAHLLHVKPENCIVFEDAPKGVEAALNAGMQTVVLTTMHEKDEFEMYSNVLAYVKDYTDPFIMQMI